MATNITTRISSESHFRKIMTDSEREIRERALVEVSVLGESLKRDIVARTTSGRDVRGQFFTTYRPTQAKKKGRRAPVTLVETGSMMSSLAAGRIKGRNTVTIYFRSLAMELRARHHHFGWLAKKTPVPAREWFGVSVASLERGRVAFGERMRAELQNTALGSGRLKILVSS